MKNKKIFENWNEFVDEAHCSADEDKELYEEEQFSSNLETVERLLTQIKDKLDGLEDIDTSIDYLVAAITGDSPEAAQAQTNMFGRFATPKGGQNVSENYTEDKKDIETIIGNYELSDVKEVLKCMQRLISLNPKNPEGLKVLYQEVAARKQEEEQMGDTVMVDAYNDILTKIPAYLASKEEWVNKRGNMTQTEKWLSSEIGPESKEEK
jgi:histidinol-phosphate/aromatic aminotransferase/cobyric acid decarboxylase-like protein